MQSTAECCKLVKRPIKRTKFYVITVVKLRFLKANLRLGGGRSKSSRGPPIGHRWSKAWNVFVCSKTEIVGSIPHKAWFFAWIYSVFKLSCVYTHRGLASDWYPFNKSYRLWIKNLQSCQAREWALEQSIYICMCKWINKWICPEMLFSMYFQTAAVFHVREYNFL
jgi:hypothetical protein